MAVWSDHDDDYLLIRRGHLNDLVVEAVGRVHTDIEHRLSLLEKRIVREIKKMAEQTQAAVAELTKDLQRLADGYVAQQAIIKAQADALAAADTVKAQAVADAIAADDSIDTAAINTADAIIEGLVPEPAPEPTAPEA